MEDITTWNTYTVRTPNDNIQDVPGYHRIGVSLYILELTPWVHTLSPVPPFTFGSTYQYIPFAFKVRLTARCKYDGGAETNPKRATSAAWRICIMRIRNPDDPALQSLSTDNYANKVAPLPDNKWEVLYDYLGMTSSEYLNNTSIDQQSIEINKVFYLSRKAETYVTPDKNWIIALWTDVDTSFAALSVEYIYKFIPPS